VLAVTINAAGFVTRTPFAPLPLVVIVALGLWYARALRRLDEREHWSGRQTVAWFIGLGILAIALCSGMAGWDADSFLIHGATDAAVGMVAPFALALGAPLTLARAAGGRRAKALANALVDGPARRAVFQPLLLWVFYSASLFGLYFFPVYRDTRSHLVLLDLCHLEFALAGCLFIWPLVGADLAGSRMGQGWRMAWIGFGIPYYSVFGMALLSVAHSVAPGIGVSDVHAGGDIIWSTGEVISVAGAAAMLVTWMFAELSRVRGEEALDREALDLQASMWRVSRILAKTEAEREAERTAALAASTVPARTRGRRPARDDARGSGGPAGQLKA